MLASFSSYLTESKTTVKTQIRAGFIIPSTDEDGDRETKSFTFRGYDLFAVMIQIAKKLEELSDGDSGKANDIEVVFSDVMFGEKYRMSGPLAKKERDTNDYLLRLLQEMTKLKLHYTKPKSWIIDLRVFDDGVDEYDTYHISGRTAAEWGESMASKLEELFAISHSEPEIGFSGVVDRSIEEGFLKAVMGHYTDKFRF